MPTGLSFDQKDVEDPEYVVPDNKYYNDNACVMSLPTM
jgi:hypothetical protein